MSFPDEIVDPVARALHAEFMPDEPPEACSLCPARARAALAALEAAGFEIESKAVRDCDRRFYRLAVTERDHAWAESARHKRERDAARAELARLRGAS